MKITPLIIGAINAQSGDDADRWDAADFTFNSDVFNYSDGGAAKWAADETALSVNAVTCWESNNMGDLNHYVTQSDDGFGWENIHHGHGPDQGDTVYQTGSYYQNSDASAHDGDNSMDMHSALAYDNRLSGCIYEADGWAYSATTYDHTFKVEYGLTDASANTPSGNDASGDTTVRPVWWHYFNAHIIPGQAEGANDYKSHARHLIVMANPSYEGLGYLNFIVTYGAFVDGDDRWDDNENANTRGLNTDQYSSGDAFKIVMGGDNDAANDNFGQWYSSYNPDDKTWDKNMPAISSFPHNDLGKDFRFNVRILHHGGNGDPDSDCGDENRDGEACKDSYYWYKVDEIKMTFPHTVRCPRENKNLSTGTAGYGDMKDGGEGYEEAADTFRCMDSANFNGHRGWNSETAKNNRNSNWSATDNREDIDKPWFLENLGADHGLTGAAYAGTQVDGDGNTDVTDGFICGGVPLADGEWFKCGTHYTVKGLMNTYDEFAQQEFGTMQEFWFQFHYHFVFRYDSGTERNADHDRSGTVNGLDVDVTGSSYSNGDVGYDHRHNFPNILFNAFDVSAISMYCTDTPADETRMNSNTC